MTSFIALPRIDSTFIEPLPSAARATGPSEIVLGDEIVSAKATLPSGLSPIIVTNLLRRELEFDGLVVTDALDMSALTIYFNQDEAAVRAIEAGADMLIKPSDPDAAIRGLREAVTSGRIKSERIEKSARRILAIKYDLGLLQRRETLLDQVDELLSDSEVSTFGRDVAKRALTLIRNNDDVVPIEQPAKVRVFNFAITNGDDRLTIATPFVEAMKRSGVMMETMVLDARSSPEDIEKAQKKAEAADCLIASLYGRVRAGEERSASLPKGATDALTQLTRHKSVIAISFGNPYLLENFHGFRAYLVAYGDMPALQNAAAAALLGENDITGRLPITIPMSDMKQPSYPRGSGILLKAKHPKSVLAGRVERHPRAAPE